MVLTARLFLLFKSSLVCGLVHQSLQFGLILDLNLEEPTICLGRFVHGLWFLLQCRVDLNDSSGDRCHDIGGRLDGFDSTNGLSSLDFGIASRQFDKNDVSERFGGVFGDTDGC